MAGAAIEDLGYAWRAIARRKGMAALVAAIAALGIGAAVTVFGIADAFLLRGLPFAEPERLVWLQSRHGDSLLGVSHADAADWNDPATFAGVATFDAQNHAVVTFEDGAESLLAARVGASLFPVLGVAAQHGRVFGPEEDKPGSANVVLLSDQLWRRRFGAAPGAVGGTVKVDGLPHTIAGVMPPGFDFPSKSDLWVPSSSWSDQWPFRNVRVDSAIARLAPGISPEAARSRLATVARNLESQYPDTNAGIAAEISPLREVWSGKSRRGILLVLGASAFLLLIACSNVATLLLVWAAERERDMALRLAVGAPPARLMRQVLLESLLLGLLGGAGGLLLAFFGIRLAGALLPAELPGWLAPGLDGRAVAFAAAISLAVGLVFGLAPTLRTLGVDAAGALGQAAGRPFARRRARLRRGLVLAQVTLALTLAAGAGLLAHTFAAGREVDNGYGGGAYTFRIDLPVLALESYAQVGQTYARLLGRLEAVPGVAAVGATTSMPLARKGTWDLWDFTVEGQDTAAQKGNPRAYGQGVSRDYFRAMDIALLAGHTFERGTPGVVVSRSLAERFWPGRDAIGQRLKLGPAESPAPFQPVVGVAEDVRFESAGLAGAGDPAGLGIYLPLEGMISWPLYVAVLAPDLPRPATLLPALREEVHRVSLDLGVQDAALMAERVEHALWRQRLWAILFATLAGLALLLAGAGIYGVVSQLVQSRLQELAVRLALGAGPGDIARTLIGESARLTAWGAFFGLAASFALGRILASQLAGVKAADPLVFLAALAVVALMSLVASCLPLWRALRLSPAAVLKYE
jgi:predicted permease